MQQVLTEKLTFLKTAFTDHDVAALSSSSRYVVKDVLALIQATPKVVFEYGAGNGVMTRALLKIMDREGMLIAIESNPLFCQELEHINDSRLRVFSGTVQEFHESISLGDLQADLIVSSIPFSFLTKEERGKVMQNTKHTLSKDGQFIIFHQYTTLMKKYVRELFHDVVVKFEPRNILPCFIMSGSNISS